MSVAPSVSFVVPPASTRSVAPAVASSGSNSSAAYRSPQIAGVTWDGSEIRTSS